MRIWTAHTRPGFAPVLVREGFSLGALVLGPFWLFLQRAWLPGLLMLVADVLLSVLVPGPAGAVVSLALSVLLGLFGRDLVRSSLARRGFAEAHVLAARDEDAALARLLAARPDLMEVCA